MVNFKGLIINVILLGVFVFALMVGANQFAISNDINNTLLENEAFSSSFDDINETLSDVQSKANQTRVKFETERTTLSAGFLLLETILDFGKTFTAVFVGMFNIIFTLFSEIGIPPLILSIIMGILIIMLVLGAWRVYKAGE